MKQVTAESYTLRTKTGDWLGQIVLTSDGMFASVTDYGNFSYCWRAYGDRDFREFIRDLGVDYFATKMATGLAYMVSSKKIDGFCRRYAEKILPALQQALREELEQESVNARLEKEGKL